MVRVVLMFGLFITSYFFVGADAALADCADDYNSCVTTTIPAACSLLHDKNTSGYAQCLETGKQNCVDAQKTCEQNQGAAAAEAAASGAAVDAPAADPTPKAAAGKYGLDVTVEEAAQGQAVPNVDKTVMDLIGQFISIALSLVATIFFVLMVYAGYLWMTARGETDQVNTAKSVLSAAVIGVIVVSAAYVIVKLVIDTFG